MVSSNRSFPENSPVSSFPGQVSESTKKKDKSKVIKKIVVRSHSKAIYYYPTILLALICAWRVPIDGHAIWGNIFLPVFFCNTVVVMFDFNSLRTLFSALTAMVIGFAVWNLGLTPFLSQKLSLVHVEMNTHFYWAFAAFFGLLLIADMVWAHLNRWEFSANEVKHIQAFAGHTANFPGRGLRFQVKTVDVFERVLLGAGTLILSIGKKRVRIQNVVLVNRQVRELERFVRTSGVFADDDDVFMGDDDDEFDDEGGNGLF